MGSETLPSYILYGRSRIYILYGVCWSARYEICAASSEECVFDPPNLYDVRKHRVRMVNGFILVVLVQVWLGSPRYLLALVPQAADVPHPGLSTS